MEFGNTLVLTFFIILSALDKHSTSLVCYSETDNMISNVNCSATLLYYKNCSDNFLVEQYGNLYLQQYWATKPSEMTVTPFYEHWYHYLLPGFQITLVPPRTGSLAIVRGFQIDFQADSDVKGCKCVVVKILNRTLDYRDRDNNLRFIIKIKRMMGNKNYRFKSWTLPRPPAEEKTEYQVRYGRTGTYAWALSNAPSDWLTSISYHNNTVEKYIHVWFAPAPVEYMFTHYVVTLQRIWTGEGTNQEHRNITGSNTITKTSYTFTNVKPGRYRVLVQPFDDKVDSLNECKCKMKGGGCGSCLATKTDVIVIGEGLKFYPGSANSVLFDSKYLLPTILGIGLVVLAVIISVVCYHMYQKRRGHEMVNSNIDKIIKNTEPVQSQHTQGTQYKKTTIFIISTMGDDSRHTRIIDSFATFLKVVCHFNIIYQPFGYLQNKQKWISNAIDQADYVIIALTHSAVVQYESWVENSYHDATPFIECLVGALDKSVEFPAFGDKIVIMKFAHTSDVPIPYDLINKKVFVLTAELHDLLLYINQTRLDCSSNGDTGFLREEDIANYRDGRNLLAAIDGVWQTHGRFPSGDSGYVDFIESEMFIPPSPTISNTSQVDMVELQEKIYEFNLQ